VKFIGLTVGSALALPVLASMALAFSIAAVSYGVASAIGFGVPEGVLRC